MCWDAVEPHRLVKTIILRHSIYNMTSMHASRSRLKPCSPPMFCMKTEKKRRQRGGLKISVVAVGSVLTNNARALKVTGYFHNQIPALTDDDRFDEHEAIASAFTPYLW